MSAIAKLAGIEIVNATKQHTASLFFFHGSGSCGSDMKQWIDMCNRGELKFPHIKVLYPTAPLQPYTPNDGMPSNVWFDRKDININVPEELGSVDSMCGTISELVEKEVSNGIPTDRIVLGGFSMGGALAFYMSYRCKPTVAGCFAMSSFLNKNSVVYEYLKESSAKAPPLLQFHGTIDDLVPLEWGRETHENLKGLGVNGRFVTLDKAGHQVTSKEVQSLRQWILDVLPEK